MKKIDFTLNGRWVEAEVRDNETLLEMLRERFHITSVKEGCSIGECGVCTDLIDDAPVYSCLALATRAGRRHVKTVEYLAERGSLHPLQESFISQAAVQCGYCTPGMLLVAYSLLLKNPEPDEEEIREAISGNLCRCTGYVQIVEAIQDAARVLKHSA